VSTTKPHEKLVKELAAEQEMQVDSAQFDVKLFEQRAITAQAHSVQFNDTNNYYTDVPLSQLRDTVHPSEPLPNEEDEEEEAAEVVNRVNHFDI